MWQVNIAKCADGTELAVVSSAEFQGVTSPQDGVIREIFWGAFLGTESECKKYARKINAE